MRTLNILVAEDDDQNQAMMKLILVRQGHNVTSAWNGLIALETVKSGNFDLVFMDVQMPEMDGLEATRQIRLWEKKKKHTPIVLLTGSVPQNITEEYKNAGADTYLQKPYDVKRIKMLAEIIAGESETGFQKDSHQYPNNHFTELPLLDMQDSLLRFNGDSGFYLENLQEFLNSLPNRQEMMDLAQQTRNWHDLTTCAHNLKGVAANFGAKQLSTLASRLEEFSENRRIRLARKAIRDIGQNINALTELTNKIFEQQHSQNINREGRQ